MDSELVARFLIAEMVPRAKVPDGVESSRLWDAIWRAHRDVLAGRYWLEDYIKAQASDHPPTVALYQLVSERLDEGEPLATEPLLNALCDEFRPQVEFGALQKLVNMTLKYVVCLNACEPGFRVAVDERACDCPVDSIVLGTLPGAHTPWTRMSQQDYAQVQREITDALAAENMNDCGNLTYDFTKRHA